MRCFDLLFGSAPAVFGVGTDSGRQAREILEFRASGLLACILLSMPYRWQLIPDHKRYKGASI
jgi:hypothetical protein